MLKPKLQYFVHLVQTADSLEKTLMLEKIEGRRTKGWQRMEWFDGIIDSMGMSLNKVQEVVKDKEAWHAAVQGVTKSWTWFSDWTTRLFLDCPSGCVQFSLSEESNWEEACLGLVPHPSEVCGFICLWHQYWEPGATSLADYNVPSTQATLKGCFLSHPYVLSNLAWDENSGLLLEHPLFLKS